MTVFLTEIPHRNKQSDRPDNAENHNAVAIEYRPLNILIKHLHDGLGENNTNASKVPEGVSDIYKKSNVSD